MAAASAGAGREDKVARADRADRAAVARAAIAESRRAYRT
jgi:hypothetical protein